MHLFNKNMNKPCAILLRNVALIKVFLHKHGSNLSENDIQSVPGYHIIEQYCTNSILIYNKQYG